VWRYEADEAPVGIHNGQRPFAYDGVACAVITPPIELRSHVRHTFIARKSWHGAAGVVRGCFNVIGCRSPNCIPEV
jgi:hypothetical protein